MTIATHRCFTPNKYSDNRIDISLQKTASWKNMYTFYVNLLFKEMHWKTKNLSNAVTVSLLKRKGQSVCQELEGREHTCQAKKSAGRGSFPQSTETVWHCKQTHCQWLFSILSLQDSYFLICFPYYSVVGFILWIISLFFLTIIFLRVSLNL